MARPEITVLNVSPSQWSYARLFPGDDVKPKVVGAKGLRIDDQQYKVDIGVRPRGAASPRADKRNCANRVVRRRPRNDSLDGPFGSLDMIPHL